VYHFYPHAGEPSAALRQEASQLRAGALPAHVWDRWERTLAWWVSQSGVAAWWRGRPTPFNDAFTALVERRLADPQLDPAQLARWRAFVANPHFGASAQATRSDAGGDRPAQPDGGPQA